MSIKDNTQTILIESVLGGQSPTTYFASKDQYMRGYGFDPAGINSAVYQKVSGVLNPVGIVPTSNGTTINAAPLWIVDNPKDVNVYFYDNQGSAYTYIASTNSTLGISDGGSLSNSTGNGAEYYDNYVYFAKNTTIARYGPLDGTPAFDGDYWSTTLSKTALTNTTYPIRFSVAAPLLPNHVMHRHSDGKLYIADVQGNQGYIHLISTTKTTVEGDTDAGSTFGKLTFGYGLYPTSIESYGSSLAISLIEFKGSNVSNSVNRSTRAKLAFWDTTSQNFNSITWVEFPDPIITALKNVNGVLYIISCNYNSLGFRVSRYIGGNSIEEVAYIEDGVVPIQGGVDASTKRLLFGSSATTTQIPIVYSYGLQKSALGQGLHAVMRAVNSAGTNSTGVAVTALRLLNGTLFQDYPIIGLAAPTGNTLNVVYGTFSSNTPIYNALFWSSMFRIGRQFKIKKIRIPLGQAVAAGMSVTPKIYIDDGVTSQTLVAIDNTSYPNAERNIVIKPIGLTGSNNFWLELSWSGTVACIVGLPISIEYEIIPD